MRKSLRVNLITGVSKDAESFGEKEIIKSPLVQCIGVNTETGEWNFVDEFIESEISRRLRNCQLTTIDEAKNLILGEIGTPKRDRYEYELHEEMYPLPVKDQSSKGIDSSMIEEVEHQKKLQDQDLKRWCIDCAIKNKGGFGIPFSEDELIVASKKIYSYITE